MKALRILLILIISLGLMALSIQVGIDREKQAAAKRDAAQNRTPPIWENITTINISNYGT